MNEKHFMTGNSVKSVNIELAYSGICLSENLQSLETLWISSMGLKSYL